MLMYVLFRDNPVWKHESPGVWRLVTCYWPVVIFSEQTNVSSIYFLSQSARLEMFKELVNTYKDFLVHLRWWKKGNKKMSWPSLISYWYSKPTQGFHHFPPLLSKQRRCFLKNGHKYIYFLKFDKHPIFKTWRKKSRLHLHIEITCLFVCGINSSLTVNKQWANGDRKKIWENGMFQWI